VGIGAPLGMFAGTYLAEYGRNDRLTSVIRFINDILLSAPSIIIGLFIYGAVVVPMGGFSALAGSLALAVIVIPVVLRTTEDMLLLVPNPLREAASALGLPRSLVIKRIAYRAARSGLITGVLLATARVAGETAPLLFTALSNQFFSLNLTKTMANVTARNLNFYYGEHHALKNINLTLGTHRVTAFIGPSGCGKSTLLRIFNRMYDLYPGQRAVGQLMLDQTNILDPRLDLNLLRA